MKELKHLVLAMTLLTSLSLNQSFGENVYPGQSIYFLPQIQSELSFPLAVGYESGGAVKADLSVRGLFFEMLSLGITGEYGFYTQSAAASIYTNIGIEGGYTFILPWGLSVTPAAGFNLVIPVNTIAAISPDFQLGCELSLHLFDRSKIFLDGSVSFPLTTERPGLLSLGIGIRQSTPLMLPVGRVNPQMNLSTSIFSPDGDGEYDKINFKLKAETPSSIKTWTLTILDKHERPIFAEGGKTPPPEEIQWDGNYDSGDFVSSADDYSVEFTVTDKLGRTDVIRENFVVDVLIIRENGKIKINIPNIIFPPQSADFSLLKLQDDIDKNNQILNRLFEIFKRFSAYSIHIEGHANAEHWQTKETLNLEQENELLPLSLERAELIREKLIKLGIEEDRLSVEGLGAALPIVPFADTQNNWKNRRVEFILVK
ncbi:MAG: OmpA family protein [Spirochaetales bacterium]|nr:OmpA family protein [Spirochaetales bacterium]